MERINRRIEPLEGLNNSEVFTYTGSATVSIRACVFTQGLLEVMRYALRWTLGCDIKSTCIGEVFVMLFICSIVLLAPLCVNSYGMEHKDVLPRCAVIIN